MAGGISNIHQFLGPITAGTVKETNPALATTPGSMRNMGAGDAFQFGVLTFATTSSTTNLTYAQTNAASPTGIVVLPAGAYIGTINVDVTTAFNAGTNNTITVAITPTNGVAGTIIYQVVATAVPIAVGRYTDLYFSGGTYAAPAIQTFFGSGNNNNIASVVNVSNGQAQPTDQIVQAFFTGTGTGATTGVATISIDYCLRNPDGSWYQQSPVSPVTSTTVLPLTY